MDENRTPNTEQPNQEQQTQQPNPAQPQQGQPYQQPYQPQYQQPRQPQYQPPQYQQNYYAPQQPINRGKGGGWIGFMRVMAWLLFVLLELSVVIGGGMLLVNGLNGYWGTDWGLFFSGLGVIVGGTLVAFIMIAAINISLDMAKNTERTATNTARLVEKLEEIEKKIK